MSEIWTVFRQTFVKVSIFTCILMGKCLFWQNVLFPQKLYDIDLTKTFIFWRSGVQEKNFFRIFYHKAIFCTFGTGSFGTFMQLNNFKQKLFEFRKIKYLHWNTSNCQGEKRLQFLLINFYNFKIKFIQDILLYIRSGKKSLHNWLYFLSFLS